MVHNVKVLDPVQGLIDYINDIKPYHSKIIESLVEYVGQENVDVSVLESWLLNIDLDYSYDIGALSCVVGGYGALPFDDPMEYPVLSPDPAKTILGYPSLTNNSFIVLGDQRDIFDTNANLTFNITSFTEDRIINVTASVSDTGGEFYLLGDRAANFPSGTIFTVSGSVNNDGGYQVTSSPGATFDGTTTRIPVDGQNVSSDDISGFIKTIDTNNNGNFAVIGSIFTEGTIALTPYTTVFISGITLIPPSVASLDLNQRYISLITIKSIDYKKILSYSNALKHYTASPMDVSHTPNEGVVYAPIVDLSQSSPSYFVVEGNFENSNIFVGDEIVVVESTDNNTTYIIQSISYDSGSDETTLGVTSIHDSSVDGFVKFNIPSNVFIVDNDYTDFFRQGTRIKVITGSVSGNYTTLYSRFINNETHIRVLEDILYTRGRQIVGNGNATCGSPLLNGLIVEGNVESIFVTGTQFNVVSSIRNDGSYTTIDSIFCSDTNNTIISIAEAYDSTDITGEIHRFVPGSLTYLTTGFGETPQLCDVLPQTLVNVHIKDRLFINNMMIFTPEDVIAYGINNETIGYDLPPSTIFSSGAPTVVISSTEPASPTDRDLWFDTSLNTGSPTAPGILMQYRQISTGPDVFAWIVVENSKAYWIDTDTNYMYYRTMYQYYHNTGSPSGYLTPSQDNNQDTGWVLEYTKIPGYNDLLTGVPVRTKIGFETFFAIESSTSIAETMFTLSTYTIPITGSPALPDPDLVEVYINGVPAGINILSETTFDILTPSLRVGDFVEVRIFNNSGLPTNSFVGSFDANAAIVETFDMIKGYKFTIDGTESIGSPAVNKVYIPDTQSGEVFNIFTVASPLDLADTALEIISSEGSPNIDGNYTILAAEQFGSPNTHVVLTVAETLQNTGIFSGSPLVGSGCALFQQWYQYLITNTTSTSIIVSGDATADVLNGASIKIVHSNGSPNNDGTYTVNGAPIYDGRNTAITTVEVITNTGNSGGWVESI